LIDHLLRVVVVHLSENAGMREALARIRGVASGLVDAPAWSLSDAEVVDCLDEVHRAEQALAAVRLHLVRQVQGRDLPGGHGASGVAVWLRSRLRISIRSARRQVELAARVDRRPVLDAALSAAVVNAEQAQVIATVVADLPDEVGAAVIDKAEAALVDYAGQFDPDGLRRLGGRILSHVAPEVAEQAERTALQRAEANARAGRGLTLSSVGDGRVRVSGCLDAEGAAVLTAALDPLCSPRTGPAGDERSPAQRRADALVEVCQLALRTDALPDHGGQRPQLVVTVPFDLLRGQLGAGMLDTGQALSATAVRRLACDAGIIPAVLGGEGQVLDLGKSRRLFTGAVRRALVIRDGGCAFPSCDRPARWCDGHHMLPVSLGGPTSVDNGVLVCGFHHRLIHAGDWQVRLGPDRLPEFVPPAYVDPLRRPQRNTYHRRP
jgi:hypothetical protein